MALVRDTIGRPLPPALLSLAVVALAACESALTPGDTSPVRFESDAWAGTAVRLTSGRLRTAATVRVSVAGKQVSVQRLDDSTAAVQVPDTTGPVALVVDLNGVRAAEGFVTVHGFAGIRDGPQVSGYPNPWPAGEPTALAFQDGRLVRLDYRDNSATVLTPDTNLGPPCLLLPTPSATEPGLVVVAPSTPPGSYQPCGRIVAVPTVGSTTSADSSVYNGWSWGTAAHLSRGRWLVSATGTFVDSFPQGGFGYVCGESSNMIVSPRGDRVVPLCVNDAWSDSTAAGAPVIDVEQYTVAYHLKGIGWLLAAAFTGDGDTLFAVGTSELLAVDAATGAVLARTSRDYNPWPTYFVTAAVAVDPARRWLYLVGWADGLTPVPFVEVIDRASLAHVATLRVPAWAQQAVPAVGAGRNRGDWTLLASPTERRLYATMTDGSTAASRTARPSAVLIFDLMP